MMSHDEKRIYLIEYLLKEKGELNNIQISNNEDEQKRLLRGLFNIRMPQVISNDFLKIQNAYLKEATEMKGITDYKELSPIVDNIYLWQGDITTLKCDAIVNAANSGMTGCYVPNHNCIDNAIHTYAGVELRYECNEIIEKQGHEEKTGKAKITKGYNLPAKYVIHTVGAIVNGNVTKQNEEELKSCYLSCIKLADDYKLESIAFSCISTGIFGFPNERAAEIAIRTIMGYLDKSKSQIKVIFNVFKECDYEIYKKLLGRYRTS